MPVDSGVGLFQVRTEERDGRLVVVMSGDLDLESAGVVMPALDRAAQAAPEILLDLRDLSFTGPGELRELVTAEALAGVRGRRRRRRLPARCRSPRGWTPPGII